MTDFNNSNNKEESVQDTLRRVMTERGYFANPVTIHTEIGDFTSYADEDSPLVKKNQAQLNAHNPFEPQAELQVKPPFSSAYQSTMYNNNSQEVLTSPVQQNGIYSTNNQSLIGKPSSNFQNNNTGGFNNSSNGLTNPISGWSNIPKPIDYSLYGDGFSREFIDAMLHDSRFQKVMMNRTQKNEGGYSNHPNDRGGKTMYGISSRWYPNEDIENLTRERANAILYRDYWLKPRINQLPDEFADIVFDDGIVQGQPTAIMNLQKALGTRVDGIIGSDTLGALENANYDAIRQNFIRNVNEVEDKYLQNDSSQRVFEKGHRDRFNKY